MSIEQIIAQSNAAHEQLMAERRARLEADMQRSDEIIRKADESLAESGYYYGIDY